MSEHIHIEHEGAVAAIIIDRAAEGNLPTTEMLRRLTATIRAAAATDAKVITLRSAGADFCRGRDPKGGPANPTALVMRDQVLQPILDVYAALQPVVCAVRCCRSPHGAKRNAGKTKQSAPIAPGFRFAPPGLQFNH